ncbi:MAG: filamentation induced by cAMP protein fic [Parcubacteria group bacterium Gr01-1014_91]|nr:MAG: filamentation induced by cAMP protein fic [Parcubacteria group bacterium Gr01-1014_91]
MNPEEAEFLVSFICESDAIEGIDDDPSLVRAQIEQKHARGHVGALLLLREHSLQKVPLRPILVRQTQALIVAEQGEKGEREIEERHRGNWRDCDVWIGNEKCLSPTEVPSRMDKLIEETRDWQKTCHKLSKVQRATAIARFHYTYLHIHPFVDGNGRSGRALVYYLYRFAGLEPFIFTSADRHAKYYPCFRDPMAPLLMEDYFRERTRLSPR